MTKLNDKSTTSEISIVVKVKWPIKNAELRKEIIKSKEQDELTKTALEMLILMSKRFADTMSYLYPEDKQDCIQGSIMDCWQYWRAYNPEYPNAFAYYTQVIKSGSAKVWKKIYGHFPKSSKISLSNTKLYNL